MYKIDELSFYFGRLEWDAYLISRGVRILGDHHFQLEDYKKIKSQIEKVIQEQRVKKLIKYHKKDNKIKTIEIIIYHPKKGKTALKRLQELNEMEIKAQDNPLAKSIVRKILENEKFTKEERVFQKKLSLKLDFLEAEYGKIYGYDESSIKEHMDALYNERQEYKRSLQ